jgi:hypothetical protein
LTQKTPFSGVFLKLKALILARVDGSRTPSELAEETRIPLEQVNEYVQYLPGILREIHAKMD